MVVGLRTQFTCPMCPLRSWKIHTAPFAVRSAACEIAVEQMLWFFPKSRPHYVPCHDIVRRVHCGAHAGFERAIQQVLLEFNNARAAGRTQARRLLRFDMQASIAAS